MKVAPKLYRVESNGKLHLSFNDAQLAAWDSQARFTFMVMGTRGGKTSFSPWWLWREINTTADPEGNNDYLAVTSTYKLFDNAFRPMMQEVFEHVLQTARYWPAAQVFELKDPRKGFWAKRASDRMWGRILMRTAEAWQSLEAMRARAAVLDECGQDSFTTLVWEAVLRRVGQDMGRILGTTTPYNLGYLYTLQQQWLNGDTDFKFLQYPSTTNPAFPIEEYERARRTMPDWRFNMMYGGMFERPAGVIYTDFNDKVHVIDPITLDPSWPTYVGVDPGPLHTAVVWVTENPYSQAYYVRKEYIEGGKTSPEHAFEVSDYAKDKNVVAYVGAARAEHQYRWDWTAAGVNLEQPPISDVEAGIDRVTALLKLRRLYIFRDCKGLCDEFKLYSRDIDDNGQVTDKIADKEKFHFLDALRYVAGMLSLEGAGVSIAAYPERETREPKAPEPKMPDWYSDLRLWRKSLGHT